MDVSDGEDAVVGVWQKIWWSRSRHTPRGCAPERGGNLRGVRGGQRRETVDLRAQTEYTTEKDAWTDGRSSYVGVRKGGVVWIWKWELGAGSGCDARCDRGAIDSAGHATLRFPLFLLGLNFGKRSCHSAGLVCARDHSGLRGLE